MAAGQHLVIGLLAAHAAWLWFWLCGSLVLRPVRSPRSPSAALLDFVLASATGIALTAAVSFALGLAHALVPLAAVLAVPALAVLLALRGDSPLRADFARARLAQLRLAFTPGALIVWMLALFLAVPAIIPDAGSDATTFYLPQAFEYAQTHALVVNQSFRFPWYPNNWVLIQTWPFVLGIPDAAQFLNWLSGAFALLGVYGLVASESHRGDVHAEPRVAWLGVAAALALAIAPIFQRFSTIGMIDVPAGTMFFGAALAALVAVRERSSRALAALILCAGFLAGMKVSFVALLPLIAGLIVIVARVSALPRRTAALALLALLLLSSPWYVRSFVLAQDPVEPLLNLRLHGVDPQLSSEDLRGQIADLRTDTWPGTLLVLPWRMFIDPNGRESRDLGTSLLVVCLPLPAAYLMWAALRRRRNPTPLLIAAVVLVYAYAYWQFTAHLERYALLFFPLLAAFVGMLAAALVRETPRFGVPALLVMLVLAIPSPAAASYYDTIWLTYYKMVGVYYTDPNTWLELRSPAYPQLEDLAHMLHRAHATGRRLYVVELGGSSLTAHRLGIEMIGEAFGPGRFADLARAVRRGILGPWLARFHVGSLLVAQWSLDGDTKYAGLQDALERLGWRRYRYAYSDWVLFVAPDLPPLVVGEGHDPANGPAGKPAPAKAAAAEEPFDLYGDLVKGYRAPRQDPGPP